MLIGTFAAVADQALDPEYLEFVDRERSARLDRLMAPDGFLNLVGLFWLEPGRTMTFGADPGNDLVFPSAASSRIGSLAATGDGVRMIVAGGADVRIEGRPVTSALLQDDFGGPPTIVRHDSLEWTVIRRSGRYALRLRDLDSDAGSELPPMPYFPVDPSWRVEAEFRAYARPREVAVGTVIEGLGWNPTSPGTVRFDIAGTIHELEAYAVSDQLFFVFGDRSNGRTTYPAGRFLYAAMPDAGNRTVLDFNLAYNPPCAFNDFSTCPVASPRNRLDVDVTAGEQYDPALYLGGE